MKKYMILFSAFFLSLVFLQADDAEVQKWQGEVSKYQKRFNASKANYNKAKASGNKAAMKKWKSWAIKSQKSLKAAKARLQQAQSGSSTSTPEQGGNQGGGTKITLTAEDRQMLKIIDSQKPLKLDPAKVLTFNKCGQCHKKAVETWKKTPHFQTFNDLHKRKRAKSIVKSMGLKGSIKRNDLCARCHYTTKLNRGKPKAISGVSCESCHGGAKDWVNIHNDKTVPRSKRLEAAAAKGQNNTEDIYQIAQNCYQCHSVGNEKLVNIGGHKAGSDNFEVVKWSQGLIRHNYVRGNNVENAKSSKERLRVMFVVGAMLDLEYALRGVALATTRGKYYSSKMKRASIAYKRLSAINSKSGGIPQIEVLMKLFKNLNFKNKKNLTLAANFITLQARKFTKNHDGSTLGAIDAALPAENSYKWKATPRK